MPKAICYLIFTIHILRGFKMQPTVLGLAFNLPNGSSGKYLLTHQDQAQASLHYLLQQ